MSEGLLGFWVNVVPIRDTVKRSIWKSHGNALEYAAFTTLVSRR